MTRLHNQRQLSLPRRASPRVCGFSMIELMIAVTIGLLLTAAVLQTFVSMKRTYEFNEEFSRIQQNGRFAMNYLTRDIRMAGHFGCFSKNFDIGEIENNLKDAEEDEIGWDLNKVLDGADNVTDSYSDYADVVPGTDVISMISMSSDLVRLVPNYSQGARIFVDTAFNADCGGDSNCHVGEILLVTDCSQGSLFQLTSVTEQPAQDRIRLGHSVNNTLNPGNEPSPTFDNAYDEGSFVARLASYAYYVARENDNDEPSLYRTRLNNYKDLSPSLHAEELVEGVEDMQILYGEDTTGNGSPNYFVPADEVVNMGDVVSVQIDLMMRSLRDNLTEAPGSDTLGGTGLVVADDRRIRKKFSTQIALRNRLN